MFGQFESVHIVFAIGALYSVASHLLMNKLVDRNKMKEIQAESKRLQKEMSEASKAKDDKRLEQISKEYEKFMPKMLEMSFMQLKPLIIIIPALAILMPFLTETFEGFIITLPFSLPIIYDGFPKLFSLDFGGFMDGMPYWRDVFGPRGWFWITVIIASISLSLIRAIYNKLKPETKNKTSDEDKSLKSESDIKSSKKPELNTGFDEKK